MKASDFKFLSSGLALLLLAAFCFTITSCGGDEEPGGGGGGGLEGPVASFSFEPDASDWKVVNFTNRSQNASSYSWSFGDGGTSTEENPSYAYSEGGTYEVILTASDGTDSRPSAPQTVTITDPDAALNALTGQTSKTWKLFRESTCMSLGSNDESIGSIWSGLTNDGSRPCLYTQEHTFHADGRYEFSDGGMFWAEYGIFNNVAGCDQNTTDEQCFEATAANMINECGDDVSAWLSGDHQFTYDPSRSELTLNGMGAWIGIPKLGSNGYTTTPVSSVTPTSVTIENRDGYDVMKVIFDYGDNYWEIFYASYSDASLEPELETDALPPPPFGEDYPDFSPSELSRTFASADAGDWVLLDTIPSGSGIVFGVDNPDGSGTKVGQFDRWELEYQELQMQTAPDKQDINFENLTTISLDVYFPSTNDYSGMLTKGVVLGFGDRGATMNWWERLVQYEQPDGLAEDEWHTLTFNLDSPNTGESPYTRDDLDMVYIGIGGVGQGHFVPGTFYIRNLVIN